MHSVLHDTKAYDSAESIDYRVIPDSRFLVLISPRPTTPPLSKPDELVPYLSEKGKTLACPSAGHSATQSTTYLGSRVRGAPRERFTNAVIFLSCSFVSNLFFFNSDIQ